MTAPTEAEIRDALTESIGAGYIDMDDTGRWFAPVTDSDMALVRAVWSPEFTPPDDHPGTLWADLRPSEAAELEEAMYAAKKRVEREATRMLLEEAVAAAAAFAEAHPDVPRGHYPLRVPEPVA